MVTPFKLSLIFETIQSGIKYEVSLLCILNLSSLQCGHSESEGNLVQKKSPVQSGVNGNSHHIMVIKNLVYTVVDRKI